MPDLLAFLAGVFTALLLFAAAMMPPVDCVKRRAL
jgi:hypothetical protein